MAYESLLVPDLYSTLNQTRVSGSRHLKRGEIAGFYEPVLDYRLKREKAAQERAQALALRQRALDIQQEQVDLMERQQNIQLATGAAETAVAGYGAYKHYSKPAASQALAPIAPSGLGPAGIPMANAAQYAEPLVSPTVGASGIEWGTGLASGFPPQVANPANITPLAPTPGTAWGGAAGAGGLTTYGAAGAGDLAAAGSAGEAAGAAISSGIESGTGTAAAGLTPFLGPAAAGFGVGAIASQFRGLSDVEQGVAGGVGGAIMGGIIGGATIGGPVGAVIGGVLGIAGSLMDDVSVICTEMYRQKEITKKELLAINVAKRNHVPTDIYCGYRIWADPVVKGMQREGVFNKAFKPVARAFVGGLANLGRGKQLSAAEITACYAAYGLSWVCARLAGYKEAPDAARI